MNWALNQFAVGGHEVGQGVLLFAEQLDFIKSGKAFLDYAA